MKPREPTDLRLHLSNTYKQTVALLSFWLVGASVAYGQEAPAFQPPQGRFLVDTVKIGQPFRFGFSFRHDPQQQVFFPDSTYGFAPFEWVGQEYFTTRTDSSGSLDSTVYQLVCFDLAARPTYQLPVYVLGGQDCTAVFSPADTFLFRSVLPATARPDTLSLRPETEVQMLRRQFNYPVFLAFLGTLGLLVLVIFWFFGKAIDRRWRLFLLQRRHRDFVRSFNRLNRTARDRNSIVETEKALVVWKKYLETVEQKPFASYTTREILDSIPDESLENALRDIDRIIYGQGSAKQGDQFSLQVLKRIALRLYRRRRAQIVGLTENEPAQ